MKTTIATIAAAALLAACTPTEKSLSTTTAPVAPAVEQSEAIAQPVSGQSSNRQKLFEAMSVCASTFPNMQQARQSARQAGFRSEIRHGNLDFFSANGRRIILATSQGRSHEVCGFGENGLYGQAAIGAVEQFLNQTYGANAQRFDTSGDREVIAGWFVGTERGPLVVVVKRIVNIPNFYRGSLIVMSNQHLQ